MEQESISSGKHKTLYKNCSNKSIAIIGAGPAGCICAKTLTDAGFEVTLFDKGKYLKTLLPTGGGRCNLSNAQYDFKELAKNYPRGEKFLYSVFSRFGVNETLKFFENIGINTYVQEDNRIFPVSNSAKEVREKLLKSIHKCKFIKEEIISIAKLDNCYKITSNKSSYAFDNVIIAIGGHSSLELISGLGINIIPQTQALVGLTTQEDFSKLSGVKISNVKVTIDKKYYYGDILFTHNGVSGPVIYTISSIYARKELPYNISVELHPPFDLQEVLNKNSHKTIKNTLKEVIPASVASYILSELNISENTLSAYIGKTSRDKILNNVQDLQLKITGKTPKGEVVTCGGVDLKEINSKTMEAKKYPGLYFTGEVLDIDGLCGGFNLQACWSEGYIAAQSIIKNNQNL